MYMYKRLVLVVLQQGLVAKAALSDHVLMVHCDSTLSSC